VPVVSKGDERYVLYPSYFDLNEPRPTRRVPRELAVRGPTSEEIAKAALALKLRPVLEKGRAHPSRPWERRGRVLIEARGAKSALLHQVAAIVKEARGEQAAPKHVGKAT